MMKTREEAQSNVIVEDEKFRPLNFSTMAVLELLKNKTLALILNPGTAGIVATTEDLLIFLYVHYKSHDLGIIRTQIGDIDSFRSKVYKWADIVPADEITKGISYFLGVKEDVELNSVEAIPEPGKKGGKSKNSRSQR